MHPHNSIYDNTSPEIYGRHRDFDKHGRRDRRYDWDRRHDWRDVKYLYNQYPYLYQLYPEYFWYHYTTPLYYGQQRQTQNHYVQHSSARNLDSIVNQISRDHGVPQSEVWKEVGKMELIKKALRDGHFHHEIKSGMQRAKDILESERSDRYTRY